MTFDLYGSSPAKAAPITTTIEALQAARWTRVTSDTLELVRSDHTQYLDGSLGDEDAEWTCQLWLENGLWVFDFEHDFRGGPQEGNGTGLDASTPVVLAQEKVKKSLE